MPADLEAHLSCKVQQVASAVNLKQTKEKVVFKLVFLLNTTCKSQHQISSLMQDNNQNVKS